MITDDELSELPEDNELAFVKLEQIVRGRLNEILKENDSFDVESYKAECISKIIAAARAYDLDILEAWSVPNARKDINLCYIDFVSDVDYYTTQIRIRSTARNRRYSVPLNATMKTKIHHYIQQIKDIIENSGISDDKKEDLYRKINDFANEVDKNRTGYQSGMALVISVANTVGEATEKLEPLRKWVDCIVALFGKAKEVEEASHPGLSAPPKRLAPPRKELPASKRRGQSDDFEDTPF